MENLTIKHGLLLKHITVILVLLVLLAVPLITQVSYHLHLFILSFIAIALGLAFNMVYSTGLITLGAAAFYGIGAYSSSLLTLKLGLSVWAALPLATIITALIALALGLIIIRLHIFTFVTLTMIFGLAFYYLMGSLEFFGGWAGILRVPRPQPIPLPFIGEIRFANRIPFYYMGLLLLILIMLVYKALYSSRIGRAWNAIKQSPHLAQALSINIYRFKVLSFVMGMTACGLMGGFYAHYFNVVLPDMFSGFTSIYIQIYAALGGMPYYLLGPVIGGFFMIVGPELLSVPDEIKPIIFGILLIIVIVFFPGGIIGTALKIPEFFRKILKSIRE